MNNNVEKMVYNAYEIQRMLGMVKNRLYEFLEETYKIQTPFRVLKFGMVYKVSKQSFDNWINGYQVS